MNTCCEYIPHSRGHPFNKGGGLGQPGGGGGGGGEERDMGRRAKEGRSKEGREG